MMPVVEAASREGHGVGAVLVAPNILCPNYFHSRAGHYFITVPVDETSFGGFAGPRVLRFLAAAL